MSQSEHLPSSATAGVSGFRLIGRNPVNRTLTYERECIDGARWILCQSANGRYTLSLSILIRDADGFKVWHLLPGNGNLTLLDVLHSVHDTCH